MALSYLLAFTALINLQELHPFHVSLSQCNYNEENQKLEITMRVFADDLSDAIEYNVAEPELKEERDERIGRYTAAHFYFMAKDVKYSAEYLGMQMEDDISFLFLQIEDFPIQETYIVKNSMLCDLFADQTNIVQLQIGEDKTSVFLSPENSIKKLQLNE